MKHDVKPTYRINKDTGEILEIKETYFFASCKPFLDKAKPISEKDFFKLRDKWKLGFAPTDVKCAQFSDGELIASRWYCKDGKTFLEKDEVIQNKFDVAY